MKLNIPIQWGDGWQEFSCEIVDVAPHLSHIATFILLKDPWYCKWSVNVLEVGLNVTRHQNKSSCIENARIILSVKSPRMIHAAYRKAGRKYQQIGSEIRGEQERGKR